MVRIPFEKAAEILSMSAESGRSKERLKVPNEDSIR